MLKRHSRLSLAITLGFGLISISSSATALDTDTSRDILHIYNHKAPSNYPKWFIPMSELGVVEWLNSAEKSADKTETAQAYHIYTAKSRLPRKTLENLVLSFVKSHHFAKIDADDDAGKIMAFEFDPENPADVQTMMQTRRNNTVVFETYADDTFSLELDDEMAADLQ
ncbi:hypothetical protein [Dyella subtropica]|uniref:hypothetical protein n=1 Tax=Dyella subtropica TaxID=2992127 RepID=UPI0022551574|nr:hypothetical protein [Dyella subtropica]